MSNICDGACEEEDGDGDGEEEDDEEEEVSESVPNGAVRVRTGGCAIDGRSLDDNGGGAGIPKGAYLVGGVPASMMALIKPAAVVVGPSWASADASGGRCRCCWRCCRRRCSRGMLWSRGKSRSSMGAAISMAAKSASSQRTKFSSSMHERRNWSVSARTLMT